MTAPAQPTSDTGTLAALALGLAQRADRRRPLTDPQIFGAAADRLAAAPAFDVSAAETAAVFLDLQATQAIRRVPVAGQFGLGLLLLFYMVHAVTAATPQDRAFSSVGVLASLLALASLSLARTLQVNFTQAGALLTAAVARAPQPSATPVPLDVDVTAVQRRVDQQRVRVRWGAWVFLALVGLMVVLRVVTP